MSSAGGGGSVDSSTGISNTIDSVESTIVQVAGEIWTNLNTANSQFEIEGGGVVCGIRG